MKMNVDYRFDLGSNVGNTKLVEVKRDRKNCFQSYCKHSVTDKNFKGNGH